MRFEDWDVLIFPGTGVEAHIPIQVSRDYAKVLRPFLYYYL